MKAGKIYARGACGDKGQVYIHIKALETMLATEKLPCNIKFLIEGEEESGSVSLAEFLDNPQNISPNEHFILDHFYKGMKAIMAFYSVFATLHASQ